MNDKSPKLTAFALCLAMVGLFLSKAMASDIIPRISKEELKVLIDYTDVTILDVRTDKDWKSSEFKIKGAVKEDPGAFKSWAKDYPKNQTIILYCACPNEATSVSLSKQLMEKGYTKVYALKEGWTKWLKAKYPVAKK